MCDGNELRGQKLDRKGADPGVSVNKRRDCELGG
jgi:hypothetical protein